MKVIRIEQPVEELWDFLVASARACQYSQPELVAAEIMVMTQDQNFGLFVAIEGEKLTALAGVLLPRGPIMEVPQVLLIRSLSQAGSKAVCAEMVDFCKAAGYNKAWGLNRSGLSNEVIGRLFGHVGEIKEAFTLLEYSF